MSAPAAVKKDIYRIRLRRSAKGFTMRCSCSYFCRRRTERAIEWLAEEHAWIHAQRGEANSIERGALLNTK